jgi:calcineurin-like phosphoesterase family protein
MNVFFTSDTHFGHKTLVRKGYRPFATIEEHDETIIENWNMRVSRGDWVYHLGDFAFSNSPEQYLERLNGHKVLITGNHDKNPRLRHGWDEIHPFLERTFMDGFCDRYIVMCHYAMRVWNKSHYGSWHLFGHSHGTCPPWSRSFDVGVDCHNFTPLSLSEVSEIMKNRPYEAADRHKLLPHHVDIPLDMTM